MQATTVFAHTLLPALAAMLACAASPAAQPSDASSSEGSSTAGSTTESTDLMDCPAFTRFEDCYPDYPGAQLAFEIIGAEVPCAL